LAFSELLLFIHFECPPEETPGSAPVHLQVAWA
jgi:hypothetical protein